MESQMDRYIWYPSRKNLVSKGCVKLQKHLGGINYPDIETRIWAMRLLLLIKRLGDKEAQTWHKMFDIYYARVRDASYQSREYSSSCILQGFEEDPAAHQFPCRKQGRI